MMHKRAASHVDWAISMGIFLVYILSMFILIQPGIQPFYKETNLVSVVENGIKEDIYYNITKIPIYFEVKGDNEKKKIDKDDRIELPLPNTGDNTDFNITFRLNPQLEESVPFDVSSNIIKFSSPEVLSPGNTYVFWLYYATDKYRTFPYPSVLPGKKSVSENLFTYSLGTPEKIFGIDQAKLNSFPTDNCADQERYSKLKDRWKYPSGKDLAIYYVPSGKIPYDYNADKADLCSRVQPFDQSNVYVKEWSDWILNTDGNLKATVINVKIW